MRRIAYRQILIPDTVFDIERDETELLIAELRLRGESNAPTHRSADHRLPDRGRDCLACRRHTSYD
jgi:hypothetical protein